MKSTGVFLCTCNQKIVKAIDVDSVVQALSGEAVVKSFANLCLPDGIRSFQQEVFENNLERVVVAACPARFEEKHLQTACVEAGLNPNHFALVDWREGCAWAHRGDKEGATAQAIDILRMGLARVQAAPPIDGVLTRITPQVLVIGGGIAGMTAATALADRGIRVVLVEREADLGGAAQSAPLNGHAGAYDQVRDAVIGNSAIEMRLGSHVAGVQGSVGNYRVEIAGNLGQKRSEVVAGAVVVATGSREQRNPQMFRHDGRRVLTLGEFERENPKSDISHRSRGAERLNPKSLVYILCAGSRDANIPYCSNTCCLDSLHQAIRFKRANPNTNVTILFRDLYLLGDELNEDVVREARRVGIEFTRYAESTPPRVEDEFVVIRDRAGMTRWIGYDRIVLATPQVPREDAASIAKMFRLARDDDGFFADPHWRLRPEGQAESGVFVCGSAHRPVDFDTAVMQGLTAAARAARFVSKREVMRAAVGAHVDAGLCTGCAQCVSTCPVDAISLTPDGHLARLNKAEAAGQGGVAVEVRAAVDPFLCLACGNCVPACPPKAIDLPSATDEMIFAQIEAALGAGARKGRHGNAENFTVLPSPRVVVFACQWSGVAAMELAGARRIKYSSNVRVVELPCSARLDSIHVLYALLNGAESVMLALCPPQECHFSTGNRYAEARIERLRAELTAHGLDPKKLQIARMMGDDPGAWVSAVERCRLEDNLPMRARL